MRDLAAGVFQVFRKIFWRLLEIFVSFKVKWIAIRSFQHKTSKKVNRLRKRIYLEKASNWKFSHDHKIRLFLLECRHFKMLLLSFCIIRSESFQSSGNSSHIPSEHIERNHPNTLHQISDQQFFPTASDIVNTFNGKYLCRTLAKNSLSIKFSLTF